MEEEEKKFEAGPNNQMPGDVLARIKFFYEASRKSNIVSEKDSEEDSWADQSRRVAAASESLASDNISGSMPDESLDDPDVAQDLKSAPVGRLMEVDGEERADQPFASIDEAIVDIEHQRAQSDRV